MLRLMRMGRGRAHQTAAPGARAAPRHLARAALTPLRGSSPTHATSLGSFASRSPTAMRARHEGRRWIARSKSSGAASERRPSVDYPSFRLVYRTATRTGLSGTGSARVLPSRASSRHIGRVPSAPPVQPSRSRTPRLGEASVGSAGVPLAARDVVEASSERKIAARVFDTCVVTRSSAVVAFRYPFRKALQGVGPKCASLRASCRSSAKVRRRDVVAEQLCETAVQQRSVAPRSTASLSAGSTTLAVRVGRSFPPQLNEYRAAAPEGQAEPKLMARYERETQRRRTNDRAHN